MADRPELIELVRHVVLHLQVVAGDVPAAAVLCAQGDPPGGYQAGNLLGDGGARLVKRFAFQRNIVDENVVVKNILAPIERLLNIDQAAHAQRTRSHQRDQRCGGNRAQHGSADLRVASGDGLLAQLARRRLCRPLRRSGFPRRMGFFACRRLLCRNGAMLFLRHGGRLLFSFFLRLHGLRCRRASSFRRALYAVGGYHPVRLVAIGDHDAVHLSGNRLRLRLRLRVFFLIRRLCGNRLLRSLHNRLRSSSSVRLSAVRHSLHLLLDKSGHTARYSI